MSLFTCRLCGRVFDPGEFPNSHGVCEYCFQRLERMYSGVHKYIRDHGGIPSFDVQGIADELEMNKEDVALLMEMGFFERDIQTYSLVPSERQKLAREFEYGLEDLIRRYKLTTYGGVIYSRKPAKAPIIRRAVLSARR